MPSFDTLIVEGAILIYLLVLLGVAGELEVVPEDLGAAGRGLGVAPPLVPLDLIEELGFLQEDLRVARLYCISSYPLMVCTQDTFSSYHCIYTCNVTEMFVLTHTLLAS